MTNTTTTNSVGNYYMPDSTRFLVISNSSCITFLKEQRYFYECFILRQRQNVKPRRFSLYVLMSVLQNHGKVKQAVFSNLFVAT